MPYADFSKAKFHPPGKCIYCGVAGDTVLTKEHVIPKFLGGTTTIPAASCAKCGGATHAFEGVCANTYFGEIRWQENLPSRRKKRDRPAALRAIVGDQAIETLLPLTDHPSVAYLLDPPNAGIFRGIEPSPVFSDVRVYGFAAVADLQERIARLPDKSATFSGTLPVRPFFRLLAKIAHCVAVAERGIEGFRPFLVDFILTGSGNAAYYIGGAFGRDPPGPDFDLLHRIGTKLVQFDGKELVVAEIRLFDEQGDSSLSSRRRRSDRPSSAIGSDAPTVVEHGR